MKTKSGYVMEVRHNTWHNGYVTMMIGYGKERPVDYINVPIEEQKRVGEDIIIQILTSDHCIDAKQGR